MTATATLIDRYTSVRARIADAARRSGRPEGEIMLVATEGPPTHIRGLLEAGHRDLGEPVQTLSSTCSRRQASALRVLTATRAREGRAGGHSWASRGQAHLSARSAGT